MRSAAVALGLLTSCASAYTHGTLLIDPESGARWANARAYHCVDVNVRPEWFAEGPPGAQMITVELGNTCDVSVETNFRALRVELARWHTEEQRAGAPSPALPWDPRGELRRARLAPGDRIMERLLFVDEGAPVDGPIVRACVSLRGVVPGAEDDGDICFERHYVRAEDGELQLSSWAVAQ